MKIRTAPRLTAAAAVLTAMATLAACSGGPAPEASSSAASSDHGDLTLQLSWILNEEFAGEYFADSRGYFTDAGFSSVNMVPGPSSGVSEVASGTADVAIGDAVGVGAAIASEGAPLKIIGTTFQRNPLTIVSLATGADIATPEDMIGKRIGVQDANTSSFQALLAANDIDASELEIVPVQYDASPVVNGEVDGMVAFVTNQSVIIEAQGVDVTDLLFADNGLPFVAESFVTTDQAIAEDRERLKAFLVAEIRGWTDAVNDPAEGARLAVEEYGADLGLDLDTAIAGATAQAELLVVSDDTVENGLFTISDDLQAETIDSLARSGIVIEPDALFDMSLLDEVYAENPDLIAYAD
ncbi:ABC transporter substrate-binding protein [Microbacterium sp. P06]|uniref:ABC transporter substrate-binding protein n=1 Tax=unclassified Microbacterium TaxID=2609290 RepID=UPI003747113C